MTPERTLGGRDELRKSIDNILSLVKDFRDKKGTRRALLSKNLNPSRGVSEPPTPGKSQ